MTQVTIERELLEQSLAALVIANNIALVGSAYSVSAIETGVRKIREAEEALRAALQAAPAQPAEPVNAELVGMLAKARAGLSSGLWDYGPGQDEHEQCNELIEEIDALLSRAQAAPGVGVSDGYVTKEDAELLAHVIEQFEDCGETDVDDKTLMRFAAMGLLECTRFEATVKGHEIAAKTDAPLFASAQPQQKEG